MSDEPWQEEYWYYMGQSLGAKDKLIHLFRTPRGEKAYNGAPKSAVIGRQYLIEVEPGGTRARIDGAKMTDHSNRHVDTDTWRLRDREARAEYDSIAAAKRLATDNGDLGNVTLKDIKGRMLTLRNRQQRAALLAAIVSYIT